MKKPQMTEVTRVKRTTLIALIALTVLLFNELTQTSFNAGEIGFSVSIVFLILLYCWINEDTVQVVSGIILWASITLVFYLAWTHNGIFDSALFAYPCILLVAYTIGSRLLFIPLFFAVSFQILSLYVAHEANLLHDWQVGHTNHKVRAIDLIVVICLFSSISYTFMRSFKLAAKAQKEQLESYKVKLRKINNLLNVDFLTGLPNERVCEQDMDRLLHHSESSGAKVMLAIVDIGNLRQIISSLGHEVSDKLMIKISHILTALVDEGEFAYRFQSQEFALIKSSDQANSIDIFKERVLQAIATEIEVDEYEISVFCSIGIAIAPFDGNSLSELLKRAHLALQYGKRSQSNVACYFEPHMLTKEENKYFYISALNDAIENQELKLHYQPKINLQTNQIAGVEALIRWYHPERGFIAPDEFIAIAEESGQIVDITKWVIQQAVRDCALWNKQGFEDIGVAINLSAIDFRRGNLPQVVFKAINKMRLPAHLLELEITESVIFDDVNHIQSQMKQIQKKAISFAIDDFGTGYSNLGYLNQFNVATLKIDRSFIRTLDKNEHNQHIVNAIIQMSNSLGISNVAEGIEDQATADWLTQKGCLIGQGYYWSKPLPYDELLNFLQHQK